MNMVDAQNYLMALATDYAVNITGGPVEGGYYCEIHVGGPVMFSTTCSTLAELTTAVYIWLDDANASIN